MEISPWPEEHELLDVDGVQQVLRRSRASVYRYANTDPKGKILNLPFDAHLLNPEHRRDAQEPLLFHPNEVARFARDILHVRDVRVEILETPDSKTQKVLLLIVEELQQIRRLLEQDPSPRDPHP
ncbi:hypothetical protein [Prochlorothrix hollandica]|uniref:Resolvase n=1 Tax=Prochlorothrix hollandica PCC 9006 = CALU 1027 TaxID=317619 RepID=A0A0M2PT41_PROHO|nr:hypothetical protein [Prochlorothrix hollandica]KKI99695.1 resolvase [Prochlorothrix hollandica PCC 9006 = CALU 1027]